MIKSAPKWLVFGVGIITALFAGIYGKEIGSEVSKYIGVTNIRSELVSKPKISELDGLTFKGTSEEQIAEWNASLEPFRQKAREFGFSEEEINAEIMRRSGVSAETAHPLCNLTKQEVLSDAFSKGITDTNELKKLSATYDLLCFGETDIEIPEPPQVVGVDKQPAIKLPTSKPIDTSFTDKWEQERKEKCQEDINEYNICMNEFNAKMAEYSACLTECNTPNSITGKMPQFCSCLKPYNSCYKPYCM